MLSIQNINTKSVKKTQHQTKKHTQTTTHNPLTCKHCNDMLSKSLLALAITTAPFIQSCEKEILYDINNGLNNEIVIEPADTSEIISVSKNFNKALNTLGLLKAPAQSIHDVKTISFSDELGNRHYIKPMNIKQNKMVLKYFRLNADATGNEYKINVTNSDFGLKFERISKDSLINTKYFELNDDNSINEYIKIKNNLFINSVFKKIDNDRFVQIFSDKSSKIFREIKNNEHLPQRFKVVEKVDNNTQ
jgi:hypothetical protein